MTFTRDNLADLFSALSEAIEEREHCLEREDVMANFDEEQIEAQSQELERWIELRDRIAPEVPEISEEVA